MGLDLIKIITEQGTGITYRITKDSYKVYSQYEYLGWLITIRTWEPYFSDETKLEAFATPTKYSHILDIDNYEDAENEEGHYWEEKLGLEKIYHENFVMTEFSFEDDAYYYEEFMISIKPDDHRRYSLDDYDSESIILQQIVKEITDIVEPPNNDCYSFLYEKKTKLVVLKQIQRKSIPNKTGKRKNGFKNQAWAALVKERDKKCTVCGSVYDLHAHHIKPYKNHPELRLDVNNGTTLCGSCHRDWHKKNGK